MNKCGGSPDMAAFGYIKVIKHSFAVLMYSFSLILAETGNRM